MNNFWSFTLSIWSPFVSIWFELDQIICDRLTIAVTYKQQHDFGVHVIVHNKCITLLYFIIKLLDKRKKRTIPAKARNGTHFCNLGSVS